MPCLTRFPLATVMAFLSALPGRAENVDLSTVPKRDSVQLTIYNSEDLTLVRETRTVTFKKGVNPLQFSWAGTLIDPSSVELTILQPAEKLELLNATFPHDKPQMLPGGGVDSAAFGVSADGSVVVGWGRSDSAGYLELEAFPWTSGGGLARKDCVVTTAEAAGGSYS